ncbi:MAG: AhpC/TSA family protein [Prevotellaceae bacterium]|jgi:cytochrome oxidase Cu insertion factor (SCO1/SenC/PrrC family)|nr:AhpC/TSA family protein [Prevotellaceae bacterium]
MKKFCTIALATLLLSGCSTNNKFKVEGEVSDADGKMLYLEAAALRGIVLLDSVKLKGNGTFHFKHTRPESPEFYRLRIENKVINFSVDSTETIRILAPYQDFAIAYTVEGSPNSTRIKELTLKLLALQQSVDKLNRGMQTYQIGLDNYEDSLTALINRYKEEVKMQYIFAHPNMASAYFALFQKINNYLIFDPLNNREDVKCFAAVATSLSNNYPHADRTKNLSNIAIKGMKNTRPPRQRALDIPEDKIVETGIIDINLRDMKGAAHKLSDLKGKVVLVDFTIYQSAVSTPHNFMLNGLYEKYHNKGLEIYQVSLDADEHFWKTTADNLPWICVRDPNGIDSSTAVMYNVKAVPELFLISRNSELKARGETIKDLEAAVKALL